MTASSADIASMPQAVPVVSVSRLAVSFGPVRALDGVDLTIGQGEVVALAGENGAGKTTLVRCLAGDITPTGGEILLAGRSLPADPLTVAKHGVGVVWQDLSLCDNLDIASNLLLGRERRRQLVSDVRLHADASAVLARLGIPLTDTTRITRSLSGGQRQLVAIARAMADRPALLLLDEPTASLSIRHAAQVEDLIAALREQGTTIVIACHDIELMFRLADRIVVLRHGRVAAEVDPGSVHPDEMAALLSGQELDSSARRQLTRLHGLTGRLVAAEPSSSLSLILSALGAALGSERLCIHLVAGAELQCAASSGLPEPLRQQWASLPVGPGGGPAGTAAATARTVIASDARANWAPFTGLAVAAGVASSWSVPVLAREGLAGVITVFRDTAGQPERDQLELVTVYAGYAASAIERDRLLDEVTERNRVLETIREVLETLAGPIAVGDGLGLALQALCRGLQADDVTLLTWPDSQGGSGPRCRGSASRTGPRDLAQTAPGMAVAPLLQTLTSQMRNGTAQPIPSDDGQWYLAVTFAAPGGPSVLLASWSDGPPTSEATVLVEDAAHSLRLALEREQAVTALQEATALRRSQELQRDFLSRLSHELRTPLTAIRGYASSLLQTDVTWDAESQERFLTRIATESARLGRLVDDLLDFSAIELGILRLQPDWCDIGLVLEAAAACLPPDSAPMVHITCADDLPVVWADHDRLEQVFVNLLGNAVGHNPPGTAVTVRAEQPGPASVAITVCDKGVGLPPEVAAAPFEPRRGRKARTAGAGLGLSIAKGIVTAHGGLLEVKPSLVGAGFVVRLPVEDGAGPLGGDDPQHLPVSAPGTRPRQLLRKGAVARGRAGR
ncbi:MAG TPA: ATP-binding cassette domain-containing protein [Streptosporangiaceae bacterium]|nr:ATP-binding cassette domain-containing protein [Streptosporangiaceae bacterium]